MTTVALPVANPLPVPVGRITTGGGASPPTSYNAFWIQGAGMSELDIVVEATVISGVAGSATLAYLASLGITV